MRLCPRVQATQDVFCVFRFTKCHRQYSVGLFVTGETAVLSTCMRPREPHVLGKAKTGVAHNLVRQILFVVNFGTQRANPHTDRRPRKPAGRYLQRMKREKTCVVYIPLPPQYDPSPCLLLPCLRVVGRSRTCRRVCARRRGESRPRSADVTSLSGRWHPSRSLQDREAFVCVKSSNERMWLGCTLRLSDS